MFPQAMASHTFGDWGHQRPLRPEVLSGAIQGGMLNAYPHLAEDSAMDAGRGRLIPRLRAGARDGDGWVARWGRDGWEDCFWRYDPEACKEGCDLDGSFCGFLGLQRSERAMWASDASAIEAVDICIYIYIYIPTPSKGHQWKRLHH